MTFGHILGFLSEGALQAREFEAAASLTSSFKLEHLGLEDQTDTSDLNSIP